MKRYLIALFLLVNFFSVKAQIPDTRPKLVVGIVVDQMRYDYLSRFWNQYGEEGFKRLVNDGFNFKNNHFNYVPTATGPGHASVFSGTTPMNHGIISNNWYDKFSKEFIYCVSDGSVSPVGTTSDAGEMSPHRMKSSTFADENRLYTEMRGKTIGVSLKDRASILPAGHSANAAYWFNGREEANWISSSYYLKELPQWVKDFNNSGKAKSYLKTWNTLKDISVYTESGSDENNFEGGFRGKEKAVFPYDLKKLAPENGQFDILKSTPYGNDLTEEFAEAAVKGEQLGQDDITDVLTLSFSSTDYVGHNFGVNSKEIEDTYLRLDLTLAKFLKFLDKQVGPGNYTLFLTADHGAIDVPSYLQSQRVPSGYFEETKNNMNLDEFVKKEFDSDSLIANISNSQVFLNYDEIAKKGLELSDVEEKIAHYLLQQDHIYKVFTREELTAGSFTKGVGALIQNGFNQKRSGDVVFVLDPSYVVYSPTGSTHGSAFNYDTHVPLIFYGKGIRKGSTVKMSFIPDIAPTISSLLGIPFPSAATGKPLLEVLEK
ncbi:alkaline phosphatase [Christiangramia fulva]|uniref:Alkaline phosphatase n=1 Tax=Christiangramia fulva TaxID=2126553 RepID=A0A2R3Z1Q4_9FLAO|nr:alkaline phosphatase PafA [Christiangramia fulva]AVR44186.1 alkaline phosphatase [Christiangramia fulva]